MNFRVAQVWRPRGVFGDKMTRSCVMACSLPSILNLHASIDILILGLRSMAHLEDDEYDVPLRDQRYFGAGIKRKRVQFVPSTSTESKAPSLPATPSSSAASRYLEIVLKGGKGSTSVESHASTAEARGAHDAVSQPIDDDVTGEEEAIADPVCGICNRAIQQDERSTSHDSSITHQICLQHSYPPSYLDRRRKGLQVLSSQGWDPDGRRGLGVSGEGILHPIKARENPEKAGLGLTPEDLAKKRVKEKPVKLDAGKVRAMESERRKKGEKLRDAFYRSEDVEKYLGDGSAQSVGVDIKAFKQARKSGLR